jgi:hypothetical protein
MNERYREISLGKTTLENKMKERHEKKNRGIRKARKGEAKNKNSKRIRRAMRKQRTHISAHLLRK